MNALAGLLGAVPADLTSLITSPLFWGLMLGAVGIWLAIPYSPQWQRVVGHLTGLLGILLIAIGMPTLESWSYTATFWTLAALTLISAAATISMQSAVYAAIWFALSLLGTAGLFLFQGAQFVGIATVVVYAGAIVVTFLFVIMLAQPGGNETYDRLTWGWFPKPMAALTALTFVSLLALALAGLIPADSGDAAGLPQVAGNVDEQRAELLVGEHVAALGAQLFVRHLVAIEVGGVLLLVALVGAIAIAIQGKQTSLGEAGEAIK